MTAALLEGDVVVAPVAVAGLRRPAAEMTVAVRRWGATDAWVAAAGDQVRVRVFDALVDEVVGGLRDGAPVVVVGEMASVTSFAERAGPVTVRAHCVATPLGRSGDLSRARG